MILAYKLVGKFYNFRGSIAGLMHKSVKWLLAREDKVIGISSNP